MSVVKWDGLTLATKPGVVMTPRATSVALVEFAVAHIDNGACRVVRASASWGYVLGTDSALLSVETGAPQPAAGDRLN